MTAHQYGTLKYIRNNHVYLKDARNLSMVTLSSLVKRNWVKHNSGLLELTEFGEDEFNLYSHAKANFRMHEKDFSEGVKNLLHLNRILAIRKAG